MLDLLLDQQLKKKVPVVKREQRLGMGVDGSFERRNVPQACLRHSIRRARQGGSFVQGRRDQQVRTTGQSPRFFGHATNMAQRCHGDRPERQSWSR